MNRAGRGAAGADSNGETNSEGEPGRKLAAGLWVRLALCHGLVMRSVRRRVTGSETTLPQFDVLAQLLRHPGGMTSTDLSRALLVTAGNLTGIVDRLEARGLVLRKAPAEDRRVRVLTLTPKGKRLARREVTRHEEWLDHIFAGLAPKDREDVQQALDTLRGALEKSGHDATTPPPSPRTPARNPARGARTT